MIPSRRKADASREFNQFAFTQPFTWNGMPINTIHQLVTGEPDSVVQYKEVAGFAVVDLRTAPNSALTITAQLMAEMGGIVAPVGAVNTITYAQTQAGRQSFPYMTISPFIGVSAFVQLTFTSAANQPALLLGKVSSYCLATYPCVPPGYKFP